MSHLSLSEAEVLALSPDAASTKAAQGLTSLTRWPLCGYRASAESADSSAVWGECQGSGGSPYQTQVALSPLAFKCSCPSRKFPCKHSLALLLLYARQQVPAQDSPPDWVQHWLDNRQAQAEKKTAKAAQKTTQAPANPAKAAQQKQQRTQARWEKIDLGLQELERWLHDLIAQGLAPACAAGETVQRWEHLAARMVDAQASGVAAVLQRASTLNHDPKALLPTLAHLQLLIDATRQREQLPAPLLADLMAALGWPQDKAEVCAHTPAHEDDWLVLGHTLQEREGRMLERQVWLHGLHSGHTAWLLDYSPAGRAFEQAWACGHRYRCALHFFPSAAPLRATLAPNSNPAALAPATAAPIPALAAVGTDALQLLSARSGANPLQFTQPLWGYHAQVVLAEGQWLACLHPVLHAAPSASGPYTLPLQLDDAQAWQLLALSGGQPLHLFGRWDGLQWLPLSAWLPQGSTTTPTHWQLCWHHLGDIA